MMEGSIPLRVKVQGLKGAPDRLMGKGMARNLPCLLRLWLIKELKLNLFIRVYFPLLAAQKKPVF